LSLFINLFGVAKVGKRRPNGDFWLKRWLHNGPFLVYVTYNSDAEDCGLEIPDVNRMLATLTSAGAA